MVVSTAALTLTVPSRHFSTLSSNSRKHWRVKSDAAAELRMLARNAAKVTPRTFQRARCDVVLGWPDRRDRDAHNFYPAIKPLIDGIVTDGGWLPDDNDRYLDGPFARSTYTGRRGFVVVTLTFSELDLISEGPNA